MDFFSKIINLGVTKEQGYYVRLNIQSLNVFGLLTIVIVSIYAYHHAKPINLLMLLSDFIFILTGGIILFLNSRYQYQVAIYITLISFTLNFIYTAILVGEAFELQYYLIVLSIGALVLLRNKRIKIIFFNFHLFALFGLKLYFHQHPEGFVSYGVPMLLNYFNVIIIYCITYFIVASSLGNALRYQKKLKQKNKKIEELNRVLEEKVAERTKEIANKAAELKQFTYIASHDLREPLRNIGSFVQLIQRDIAQQKYENIQEYGEYVNWAVRRMDRITNDITIYTEIENKPLNVRQIDINFLLHETQRNLSILIKESRTKITVEKMPNIKADAQQISVLFYNLLKNAIQYANPATPKIIITHQSNADYWQFSIQDNGKGIDKAYQTIIFNLFKRLHNNLNHEGSGVGLAICKKIVENHNGSIWCTSAPNGGTIFSFRIPIDGERLTTNG